MTESELRRNVVEAGSGAIFMFQHGLGADAAQPSEVFPADVPFRRVTLECRGHGGSPPGDASDYAIAVFAGDVADYLDKIAAGPIVLGGISMGAAIALRLAIIRPDLVRALVLARPAWVIEAAPENMRPFAEVGELLARFAPEEARARFDGSATAALLQEQAPDNLASLRGFFTRAPQSVTAALLTRIAADGPGIAEDQIGALAIRALVLGCDRDVLHPLAHAERLAALIPGAGLVRVTAKWVSRELYVAEFRAALRVFLMSLPAGEHARLR